MPKTNLLYIVTKLELGGAQKQLLHLIRSLDREKYKIFLFTADQGLLLEEAMSVKDLVLKKSVFLERKINFFKDIAAFLEISKFIKQNEIQIVHTHSSKAGILGRLGAKAAGVNNIVHTVHGWSFNDFQPKILRFFYIILERLCAKFTKKIIVVSFYDKKKGLENKIGEEKQYCLVRYGINIKDFSGNQPAAKLKIALGIEENKPLVGTVACFKPQKAPLDFIKTAKALNKDIPDLRYIMVGDGVLRRKICRSLNKWNLQGQVVLAGWRRDVCEILSTFDVFVLTSLWEGLPIAALEAMAAGVAVVATNTGGISEVIESGKNGFLTGIGDLEDMRKRIEELLADKQKRDEFCRISKQKICGEEFSCIRMIRDTEQVYSNLRRA